MVNLYDIKSNEKLNDWEEKLNGIFWKNLDFAGIKSQEYERPMKAAVIKQVEELIQSVLIDLSVKLHNEHQEEIKDLKLQLKNCAETLKMSRTHADELQELLSESEKGV